MRYTKMGCRVQLSPCALLCLFTLTNILIYLDRGVIGVSFTQVILDRLSSDFDLNESKAGALGSIFILGFMISSPVFAYFAQSIATERLIGSGLLIWLISTLSAGLSPNYWILLTARAATGIGEAALICLVPPLILDSAPSEKKTVPST